MTFVEGIISFLEFYHLCLKLFSELASIKVVFSELAPFFTSVFGIVHLQFCNKIQHNGKKSIRTVVHKTHLNKHSHSRSSPVWLEIRGMKDTLENTSSFHPWNNLSIKEEAKMVNTCLLHTGESMFHLFLLLHGAQFQPFY